ncbi:MAG: prepilin-type N-terminal cleavage/methylation domain-containing protein [bacterium]|jgi:prepilin-type N-terminal cleavage/methylation domain-containing protein
MKQPRGVTLIEVLVAVSLLSLLSVGMLITLRTGLGAMEKANSRIVSNRRAVAVQTILRRQVDGFLPVMANCAVAPGQPPARIPFFQGEPESMRFVSTYSLEEASRGYPRVLEFRVIPREGGRGVRLIVNEILHTGAEGAGAACAGMFPDPATGALTPRFLPIEPGPASFVLADQLAHCRFSYLLRLPGAPDEWLTTWVRRDLLPVAIRIEMTPLEPDPSRVPLVTVTAPLRITRRPGYSYANY